MAVGIIKESGYDLLFSPKYTFGKLDWNNKESLIDAFEDRVRGFYFRPIEELNKSKLGLGSYVICMAAIDFLALLSTGIKSSKRRFPMWLRDNIVFFRGNELADRLYKDFRCGLVHEGYIKRGGQLSYDVLHPISMEDDIIVVNPGILFKMVQNAFEDYLRKVRNDGAAFLRFSSILRSCFEKDVEVAAKRAWP